VAPKRVRAVVLLVSLAAIVACGGDGAPDRQAFVDEAVMSNRDDANSSLSDAQAECLAVAVVDAIGVDRLNDAKISPDDFGGFEWMVGGLDVELSSATVDELSERLANCDVPLTAAEFLDAQVAPGSDVEYSPNAYACLSDGLNARIGELYANIIAIDRHAVLQITGDVFSECPGALSEIIVAGFEDRGAEVTPEAEQCIADSVEQLGPSVVSRLLVAGEDQAGKQEFAEQVLGPCRQLLDT
jgi:hypothetical protein